ncbi:MFS transporter [Sulfitobacter faviae]|uniref:MFS transporter n=2 Tax=Roseobacteraceae TaxID=2854170 RepID=A0AAX3LKK9_9RHOB|nr:MFS transporter [Sulfitobacter faviae]WCE69209.1 MFS transporter [Sulfitobacter faviae]
MTNLADGIALLVWAWMASLLTRDPVLVAVLPVAIRLPWFLFSLPAGLVTDRMDRLRLMRLMDMVRMAAFAGAGLSTWLVLPLAPATETGTAEPVLFTTLVICALLVGTAEVFRDTAAQTILPTLVSSRGLERANARLYAAELTGNALLGPAFGAILIGAFVWLPFGANAVLFLAALIVLSGLRGDFAPPVRTRRNWRAELCEGLTFLRDAPFLQVLAVVTATWNLCHQMVVIGLILHVQENLGLDATIYGLILGAGAVGGVAGGFVAERAIARIGAGTAAQWSTLASAICFASIGLAPNGWALAIVLVLFEFQSVFWNVVSISYRQRVIPNALLGRVNGIYRLLSWGMMPIGLLLSGVTVRLAEIVADRDLALLAPFALAGLLTAVLTAGIWKALIEGFGNERSP